MLGMSTFVQSYAWTLSLNIYLLFLDLNLTKELYNTGIQCSKCQKYNNVLKYLLL